MITLKNFYRSAEWESFRKVVINDSMSEDGFVYCARCGKPILKKYDLIVHHKQELTEANVNDAMIALNPANCECVHFKCHNAIHDRWQGGNNGYKPKPKQVFIVYGSPCAGKVNWVHGVATENDLIVDIDSIWQCVSICKRYEKPDRLKAIVFDLRNELYDIIKYRNGKWQNAYIIIGGALKGDRERLKARVGADELIFIEATKDECLNNLIKRDCDFEEWKIYIDEWFEKYQE